MTLGNLSLSLFATRLLYSRPGERRRGEKRGLVSANSRLLTIPSACRLLAIFSLFYGGGGGLVERVA